MLITPSGFTRNDEVTVSAGIAGAAIGDPRGQGCGGVLGEGEFSRFDRAGVTEEIPLNPSRSHRARTEGK